MNALSSTAEAQVDETALDTSPPAVQDTGAERPLKPAMWRGWRRRCPSCGTGPLMESFLKVRDHCPVCDEPLHHQRADDGPAYLTILVVGHLMVPFFHFGFTLFRPDPMVLFSVLTIIAVAMGLYLLPRFKGLMVGVQWAKRMHGFAPPGEWDNEAA